jgi:maleate cis-trans isomerase
MTEREGLDSDSPNESSVLGGSDENAHDSEFLPVTLDLAGVEERSLSLLGSGTGPLDEAESGFVARWSNPELKLFPHQVGFTAPPMDFDAAPTDFLRIAPETVGVHGRLLHLPGYAHELSQRSDNLHLLEEVVHCMANSGADVVGQVGTNWVHAGGTDADDIRRFTAELSEKYETPFHMAGLCLVEACEALGVEKVALNSVYFWPDWRDGVVRFLRSAGLDVVWFGNFVDQGHYDTQEEVNDRSWIFPGDLALASMRHAAEAAPDAEAILVNGMPNWRRPDGLPERTVSLARDLEAEIGMPVIAADLALYWAIFRSLGVAPVGVHGSLLAGLQG